MPTAKTRYEHVVLNDDGVPIVSGTTMKVVELVLEKSAYGWSPEELHFQHPYLSLAQIYSALAYYWDNKETIDHDIEERLTSVDDLQQAREPTPVEQKLKDKGLL